MIAFRSAVLVSLCLLLTGCGGTPSADPTEGSTSPSPGVETPTPTPAEPPVVAGFELTGAELVSVDAAGIPIESYVLGDAELVIAQLADLLGEPYRGEASPGSGCPVQVAVWPDETGPLVYAFVPGGAESPVLVVKDDTYPIHPSEGPEIGEPAEPFALELADGAYDPGYAYLYDFAGTDASGRPYGGVAFLDSAGRVSSLASPSIMAGVGLC